MTKVTLDWLECINAHRFEKTTLSAALAGTVDFGWYDLAVGPAPESPSFLQDVTYQPIRNPWPALFLAISFRRYIHWDNGYLDGLIPLQTTIQ